MGSVCLLLFCGKASGWCFNQNNIVHVRFMGASSSGDQKSSEGRVLQRSSTISQKIIRIGSTWVDHKTLGRNMNMYGRINKYFMNMMGKSVMVEHQGKSVTYFVKHIGQDSIS